MGPEVVGLIASVIGLVTAVIRRKQIIEYQYRVLDERDAGGRQPRSGGLGTRFRRFVAALLLAFGCAAIAGHMEKGTNETSPLVLVFAALMAYAAYQFLVIVLVLAVRVIRWLTC